MPKILLVEDNGDLRDSLKAFLSEEGLQVTAVSSAEDAIDVVDEKIFDVAIVDINLPGKSGFSLIEYIRSEGHQYPLIAMTARDSIVDKIKGFDLGLTDYIVKPFDLLELRARIRVHLKQKENALKTPRFELKPQSLEFFADGTRIDMTNLELRIMEILMKNNHTLTKMNDIIEYAWGEDASLSNPPIRIHIANIRRKIGDDTFKIIRTISGVGYIFSDPIEEAQ